MNKKIYIGASFIVILIGIILFFQFKYSDEMINHIGCQEGEIDSFGNCWPAEQTNTQLFESADVKTFDVEKGYLAKPKEAGVYPGVIMIHEWWGLNDNIKNMAKILAQEGYIVYAVDLYNGEIAKNSSRAGELAGNVRENPQQAIETMTKAVIYLKEQERVDKIASMGWCFGGGQSLQLSLNEKLDTTIIYYGQLTNNKNQLMNIEWPVLGIFGSEDTSITPQNIEEFKSALDELKIKNEIYIYEGVGHAFTNPSGRNYAQNETIDAWQKTINFLDENLKGEETSKISQMDSYTIEVKIQNYKFIPSTITINRGDTITWTNMDSARHTATSDNDIFDSGLLSKEESFSYEFNEAGNYSYYCIPHPFMKGVVIVE